MRHDDWLHKRSGFHGNRVGREQRQIRGSQSTPSSTDRIQGVVGLPCDSVEAELHVDVVSFKSWFLNRFVVQAQFA